MESGIFSEGKEYISASRVSKQIGYSSDYLGQLCRAKKIPGKLIGRTWYIDLNAAVEYKHTQQLAKKKNFSKHSETHIAPVSPAALLVLPEAALPLLLEEGSLTYEAEFQPQLPTLLKNISQAKPLAWKFVGEAAVVTLSLIAMTGLTFATLHESAPTLARGLEEKIETLSATFGDTAYELMTEASGTEVAAASLFGFLSNSLEFVVDGFRNLRAVAFGEDTNAVTVPTVTSQVTLVKAVAPAPAQTAEAPVQALAQTAPTRLATSYAGNLKGELEEYIRNQISAAVIERVVYNNTVLRENILLADTRPTVTRQSDSDIDQLSHAILSLREGGHFLDSTLTNATIEGPLGAFTRLSFAFATGTQATTTNFYSETASSTNFFSTNANLGFASFGNATSTNFFSMTASSTNLFSTFGSFAFAELGHSTTTNATSTNFFATTASSTDLFATRFNFGTGVLSEATTTNLFSTTASSTNLFSTNANLGFASFGNATSTNFFSTTASSTNLFSTNGVIAFASFGHSTTTNATSTNFFATTASSTNLYSTSANLGTLSVGSSSFANLLLTGSTTLQNFTFVNATGTAATTTNFFSTKGTFDSLYVNNYQQNDGTFAIISTVPTGDIFSVSDTALTNGTLIHQTLTANAGNGQVSKGQVIDVTDATTAGGGYSALEINTSGSGVGSGAKTLLSLDPGNNNKVVFDTTGSLRPTTNASTNTNSLGSSSFYWKNAYIDTLTANNLSGTVVTGATSNNTWTIGSTEASDALKAVIFQRNSGSGNATLSWDSGAADLRYLSVNYPFNATYTVSDASIGTAANLYSGALTNNTTSGTQTLLSLTNTGTGTTERGIYLNNTGTGTTGLEIAGTWTNGILTNNNTINTGSGNITTTGTVSTANLALTASSTLQNFTFVNATGTSATTTSLFSTTASSTNLFSTNANLGYVLLGHSTTTNATTTNLFSTTASSTNLFSSLASIGGNAFNVIASGNVGIGTTNPGDKFEVVNSNQKVKVDTSISGSGGVLAFSRPDDGAYILHIGGGATTNDDSVINATGGGAHLRLGATSQISFDLGQTDAAMFASARPTPSFSMSASGLSVQLAGSKGINLRQNNSTDRFQLFVGDGSLSATADEAYMRVNNSNFHFQTGAAGTTEALTILNGGNIGIGTTNPGALLDVTNATTHAIVKISAPASSKASEIDFYNQGSFKWALSSRGNTETANDRFAFYNPSSTEVLTILSGGNVGIGTTNPGKKLDIVSSATNLAGLLVRGGSSVGGHAGSGQILLGDDATAQSLLSYDYNNGIFYIDNSYNSPNGDIYLRTKTNSSVVNGLVVKGSGLVGVGTTTPFAKFAVNPVAGDTNQFVVGSSTATSFIINPAGNVGIGTANPFSTLHVATTDGNGIALGNRQENGNLYIGRTSGSTAGSAGTFGGNSSWINFGEEAVNGDNFISFGVHRSGTFGGEAVRIAAGNVGIGTTNPGRLLSLNGGASDTSIIINNTSTGGTGSDGLYIGISGGSSNANIWQYENAALSFATNNTSRWSIDANGHFITATDNTYDIGASGATRPRTVYVGTSVVSPNFLATGSTTLQNFTFVNATGTSATTTSFFSTTASSTNLFSSLASIGGSAFNVIASGNVGIGTTNPARLLQLGVAQSSDTDTKLLVGSPDTGVSQIELQADKGDNNGDYAFLRKEDDGALKINTGFGNQSGSQLVLVSGGHVGVGTSSPFARLSVGAHDLALTTPLFVVASSSTAVATTTSFIVTGAGNVGIGTANPASLLHAETSSSAGARLTLKNTSASANFNAALELNAVAQNSNARWVLITGGTDASAAADSFYIRNTPAGITPLLITSAGNVGIGTTNPANKLQVYAATGNVFSQLTTGNTSRAQYIAGNDTNNAYFGVEGSAGATFTNSSATSALFGSNGAYSAHIVTNGAVQMTVLSGGNVGIGTTNPGAPLQVNGSGTLSLLNGTNATTFTAGKISSSASNDFFYGVESSSGGALFTGGVANAAALGTSKSASLQFATNNTVQMTILSGGNVGIGSTNPGTKLGVLGNITTSHSGWYTAASGAEISTNNAGYVGLAPYWDGTISGAAVTNATHLTQYTGGGGMYFTTTPDASTYTARMVITTGGNVGIGTTNPGSLLHIFSTDNTSAPQNMLTLENAANNTGEGSAILFKDAGGNAAQIASEFGSATTQDLVFKVGNGSGSLAAIGLFARNGQLRMIQTGSASTPQYSFDSDPNTGLFWGGTADTLQFATGGVERVRFDASGLVGISTTTPWARLSVGAHDQALTTPLFVVASSSTAVATTTHFIVTGAGNIGIGTAVPVSLLHTYGGSLTIQRNSAATRGILFNDQGTNGGTNQAAITMSGSDNSLQLFTTGNSAGQSIRFFTNSDLNSTNERMRITSAGNVGIGTTTPQAALHTNSASAGIVELVTTATTGSVYTQYQNVDTGFNSTADGLTVGYNNGAFLDNRENSPLYFGTNDTLRWNISATGHFLASTDNTYDIGASGATRPRTVYVGTSIISPAATFATSVTTPYFDTTASGASKTIMTLTSAGSKYGTLQVEGNTGTGAWSLGYQATANSTLGTPVLTWTGSGNVGIGTTNPAAYGTGGTLGILEVKKASGTGVLVLSSDATADTSALGQIVFGTSGASTGQNGAAIVGALNGSGTTNASTDLQFWTRSGASATQKMVIQNGGNVGIGTTNPSALLDVNGGIRATLPAIGANTGQLVLYKSDGSLTTDTTQLTWDSTNDALSVNGLSLSSDTVRSAGGINLNLGTANSYPNIIVNGASGNVGIATSTPNNKLDIYSATKAAISFSGGTTAGQWTMGYDVSNGRFAIASSTALGTTDRFVINGSGNVGIGTTNPGKILDVIGGTIRSAGGSSGLLVETTANSSIGRIDLSTSSSNARAILNDSAGNATLRLDTGGASYFTGGSVAIGTTNPGASLDIANGNYAGTVAMRIGADIGAATRTNSTRKIGVISQLPFTTSNPSYVLIEGDSVDTNTNSINIGGGSNSLNAATDIHLFTGATSNTLSGTDRLTILSGGNVGIGTTNPSALLHVYNGTALFGNTAWPTAVLGQTGQRVVINDDSGDGILGVFNGQTGVAADRGGTIYLGARKTNATADIAYAWIKGAKTNSTSGNATAYLDFGTGSSTASPAMRIDTNGLVGIASTTPFAKLAVNPVAGDTNQFVVGSSTATSFIINPGGNVGIGTASPTSKFHLVGDMLQYPTLNGGFSMYESDGGSLAATIFSNANRGYLSLYNNGSELIRLNPDGGTAISYINAGNVGIGTSNPQAKLDVLGTASSTLYYANAGTNSAPGYAFANSTGSGMYFLGGVGPVISAAGTAYLGVTTNSVQMISGAGLNWTSGAINASADTGLSRGAAGKLYVGNGTAGDNTGTLAAGSIGVSTTTPWAKLSVGAHDLALTTPLFVVASSSTAVATSTKFIVTGAGNVGIGTSSPTSLLSLAAASGPGINLDFTTDTSLAQVLFGQSGTNKARFQLLGSNFATADRRGDLEGFSSADISFWPGDTQALTLKTTGNVGIGTTNPGTLLHVNAGASANATLTLESTTSNGFGAIAKYTSKTAGGVTNTWTTGTGVANTANNFDFYNDSINAAALTLALNGNVGIGTTNPSKTLDIRGPDSGAASITLYKGSNQVFLLGTGSSTAGDERGYLSLNNNAGAIGVQLDTQGDSYITGGNVGIGTTAPNNRLDISPAGTAVSGGVGALAIRQGTDTSAGGFFIQDSAQGANVRIWSDGTRPHIDAGSTGAGVLTINAGAGNVGIGDLTPDALLDVHGTVCLDINADDVCNDNTAAVSDSRLKDNVVNIHGALDTIRQLRGVTFNWNGQYHTGTAHSLGFLAQEVEQVFPDTDLVITDTEGYKHLDYSKLTAVLATGVQELDLNLQAIAGTASSTASSTPESESFMSAFFSNLFAKVTTWLATAGNGIQDLFAARVRTKELCLSDETGETCITKAMLDTLLANSGSSLGGGSSSSSSGGDTGSTSGDTSGTSGDTSGADTGSTGGDVTGEDTGAGDTGGDVTGGDTGGTDTGTGGESGGDTGGGEVTNP